MLLLLRTTELPWRGQAAAGLGGAAQPAHTACQPGSVRPPNNGCANRGVQGVTEMPALLMRPGRPGAAPLSWPARISSCLSPSLIEFSPLQLILMDFLVPPRGPSCLTSLGLATPVRAWPAPGDGWESRLPWGVLVAGVGAPVLVPGGREHWAPTPCGGLFSAPHQEGAPNGHFGQIGTISLLSGWCYASGQS